MLSFHNDPTIKEKYLNRLKEHARLDNIIQGTGWENGKGSAIGCTLENDNHNQYEVELGIPEWLAKLEYGLFEKMPNKEAKEFPVKFLEAIPVGIRLEQVKATFLIYLMEFVLNCLDNDQNPVITKVIKDVIYLYQSNETNIEIYKQASKAACVAYDSADSYAAAAAAYTARFAADSSYPSVYAAAIAADYASASYAAYYASASYAAYYADATPAVSYADVYNEYKKQAAIKFSNKLIELLKECT